MSGHRFRIEMEFMLTTGYPQNRKVLHVAPMVIGFGGRMQASRLRSRETSLFGNPCGNPLDWRRLVSVGVDNQIGRIGRIIADLKIRSANAWTE
jgi:hypothetical protein